MLACLRALPVPKLVENAGQILAPNAGGTIAPTINGTTLPMSPAKAFATGHVNHVSLIIGVDRDEINGGVSAPSVVATTAAQYRTLIEQKYGGLARAVMALYPISRFPTPSPFIAFRTVVAAGAGRGQRPRANGHAAHAAQLRILGRRPPDPTALIDGPVDGPGVTLSNG